MMLPSSLTARCLVAVLVVATVVVGDVGGSGPVSAQTGATATFSHDPIYSDVPPPERVLFESEKRSGGWIEHGRVWFEDGETNRIDSLSPYWAIQSLARAGVFEGTDCGVGRFCPDAHVPRWQLAVWLMRSLGETRVGNIDESRFADVDADEWWAPYVERMAELGIIGGCSRGPLRYCPDSTSSRGELAAFVSRALDLPAAEPAGFSDTDGHTHEDAIDRLAAARFSPHCGNRLLKDCDSDLVAKAQETGFLCSDEPLMYCPDSPLTKAQLTVLIFRALDWWQLNTVAESSRVPDGIFLTDYNEFSWYVKTQIVDRDGDDHPWLKAAWNITNRATSIYLADNYQSGLSVNLGIANPHGEYPHLIAKVISAAPKRINRSNQPNIVHELAHVYVQSNRVVNNPLAIAVAHLYFEDLSRGAHGCSPYELLADTAPDLIFEIKQSSHYWGMCSISPRGATEEAIGVVRDAFSGTVPQWFYDTFQNSEGNLDYEAIWEAVRGISDEESRLVVAYQLQNSFGGYCHSHPVNKFLELDKYYSNFEIDLDVGQPWVDGGGCDVGSGTAGRPAGEVPANNTGEGTPNTDSDEAATATVVVRIVARKLADSRIEFGLQQRNPNNTWGDRELPRVRFFPTTAGVNRWLVSSPLAVPPGDTRIVARKLADDRIEFGLQQRNPDNTWENRQLPRVRFFPTTAGVNRWLNSSALTLTTP